VQSPCEGRLLTIHLQLQVPIRPVIALVRSAFTSCIRPQLPLAEALGLQLDVDDAEQAPQHERKRSEEATESRISEDSTRAFVVPWLSQLQRDGG
jgi:hypothetical protein